MNFALRPPSEGRSGPGSGRGFWTWNHHGEPGEAADLPRVSGDVLQTRGHPALPAQPLQEVCQRHVPVV
ncbi:hypothetical protein KUCAC02_022068 [Chaenocephalus aceratus]|nr:hypothetical protein KUCAC02_022068 [Chaenocephalus aceratus]